MDGRHVFSDDSPNGEPPGVSLCRPYEAGMKPQAQILAAILHFGFMSQGYIVDRDWEANSWCIPSFYEMGLMEVWNLFAG